MLAAMLIKSMALLLALAPQEPQEPQGPQPSAENLAEWLKFIRPSGGEQAYREIGWRNALWPAVQEARRLGRPLLFWTMNGHPLGCT